MTIRRGATVTDDLVVADGPLEIAGTVRGRVVTLGDRAVLTRTAVVGDGIRWASDKPVVAPGAQVSGGIKELDWKGNASPLIPAAAWWLAMSVSTLVLGLLLLWLAPRAAETTAALMRDGGWGPALGVGFVLLIGLPLLALLALVTVVGIPFAIGLMLAFVPLAAVGYVTGAWVLGRRMVGPPPDRRFLAFLAGWAVLRAAALVPVLGALVFFVTALFGAGALAWTLLRARSEGGATGGPEAPLAPAIWRRSGVSHRDHREDRAVRVADHREATDALDVPAAARAPSHRARPPARTSRRRPRPRSTSSSAAASPPATARPSGSSRRPGGRRAATSCTRCRPSACVSAVQPNTAA